MSNTPSWNPWSWSGAQRLPRSRCSAPTVRPPPRPSSPSAAMPPCCRSWITPMDSWVKGVWSCLDWVIFYRSFVCFSTVFLGFRCFLMIFGRFLWFSKVSMLEGLLFFAWFFVGFCLANPRGFRGEGALGGMGLLWWVVCCWGELL